MDKLRYKLIMEIILKKINKVELVSINRVGKIKFYLYNLILL